MSSALRCMLCFRNSRPALQTTANLKLSNSGNILLNLRLQKSYSHLTRTCNGEEKFGRKSIIWCRNSVLIRNFSSEEPSGLPPLPPKPEAVVDLVGEPSFASVGLGGYSPPGLIQQGLEQLHITCDLPWWQCIVIGTCLIRLVVFPVAIYAQKNMAALNNVMPQMVSIQNKMADARKRGNEVEAMHYARELGTLCREKKVNPLKNFVMPAIQMPVFISFFLALRGMANLPIDSLHTGGALWFVDLTVPDPLYLLPLATSLTLLATVEVGLDNGMNANQMPVYFKYIFRALPVIMFPVTINFEGIILVYWLSTNFITLVQTSVLKVTAVRDFFGIPRVVPFKNDFQFAVPGVKAPEKQSFTQGLKESYSNIDKSFEIEERKRIDDLIKQQSLRAKTMESKSASTK
ncbi:mitochondrial inner membrane protein OXA1L [Nilaparvata lugens]|uniref:mitochondrial inner membrane protein OXA1L n=1 Tax=Nilaparvata lugens TaxID=108931 RepID=UPI00193E1617|nr:mitochondrial inner membrane protein OXA1L [Nilaparvata lugens]